MLTKILGVAAAATFVAGAAFAAAPDKKATSKTVEIVTCPMTNESSKGAKGGSEMVTVGKTSYKVDFCCAGCKPDFDKLSAKQKQDKVLALAKKQSGAKKS